jgi:hypothetical protein
VSEQNFWDVLGIPAGSDAGTIRRAYARKLRITSPEDDPDAFQALREAYELAQRFTAWQAEQDGQEPHEAEKIAADAGDQNSAGDVRTLDRSAAENACGSDARDELRRLQGRLIEALEQAIADDQIMVLASLFDKSTQVDLPTLAEFEFWLAQLIAANIPHTDALIAPAIQHFGWTANDVLDRRSAAVAAMLQRLDEIEALNALAWSGHPLHAGWKALAEAPAANWKMRLRALSPALVGKVQQVRYAAATHLPGLAASLDSDAIGWWDNFLAKPRFTLATLLLIPLFLGITTIVTVTAVNDNVARATIGATALLLLSISLLAPFGYLWLRRARLGWRSQVDGSLTGEPWITRGWIGALVLLPLIAIWAGRSFGLSLLLLAACLATAIAIIVTTPDGFERAFRQRVSEFFAGAWRPVVLIVMFASQLSKFQPIAVVAFACLTTLAIMRGGDAIVWTYVKAIPRYRAGVGLALAVTVVGIAILLSRNDPSSRSYAIGLAGLLSFVVFATIERVEPDGPGRIMSAVSWIMIVAMLALSNRPDAGTPKESGPPSEPLPAIVVAVDPAAEIDPVLARLDPARIDLNMLRQHNPALYSSLVERWRIAKDRRDTVADFSRLIWNDVERAYLEGLRSSSYDLQKEYWRLHLVKVKAMRNKGADFCVAYITGVSAAPVDILPSDLADRENRLIVDVLTEADFASEPLVKGPMMIPGTIVEAAAKRAGMPPAQFGAALGKEADRENRCTAHIALLETILATPKDQAAPLLRELTLRF